MCSLLLLLMVLLPGIRTVLITNLRIPQLVPSNQGSPVVLDCDYTLTPEEKNADAFGGLVVKWYLNNFDSPVYQWIPGKKPQDLGLLKGRLDVNHRASDNPATMHRALYIRNPTTDLSGDYKCLVSTFNDEDFMVKRMVVYATERSMEMDLTKPSLEAVNVTCRACGVYPEPKMFLYKAPDMRTDREVLLEGVATETKASQKSYDIVAWKLVDDSDLDSPMVFVCELNVPEAEYIVKKSVYYYSGLFSSASGNTGNVRCQSPRWMIHTIFVTFCWFYV